MIIFSSSDYYKRFVMPLCKSYHGSVVGKSEITRYPNGEMHAVVNENVKGKECLVIGSAAPPDQQLLALLTLSDTLKRNGAKSVVALLPYLGYGRQDKFGPGESSGIVLIGSLLRTSGVDKIITIDAHSELDQKLIGLPFASQTSTSLFASSIQGLGWGKDTTVVAPDEGAIARAQAMVDYLGITRPVVHLVKKHVDGIVHLNLSGEIGTRVAIVDDIIDTGHTLVSACNLLRSKGVQEIIVTVTHGLFTGEDWKQLFDVGVKTIFVSDSCPEAKAQRHPGVHVISIKSMLSSISSKSLKGDK